MEVASGSHGSGTVWGPFPRSVAVTSEGIGYDTIRSIRVYPQAGSNEVCKAIVYQHAHFEGWSAEFPVGQYNHDAFVAQGARNDDASSIKVHGSNCIATLYGGGNFDGNSAAFSEGEYGWMVMNGFTNDDASSIIVQESRTAPRFKKQAFSFCSAWEYINDTDTCAKAAEALGLPNTIVDVEDNTNPGEGCRYESGKLVFRTITHNFVTSELTMECSDGRCGIVNGKRLTCNHDKWCSKLGWCGTTDDYKVGAQMEFSLDAEKGCSNYAVKQTSFCLEVSQCICYVAEKVVLSKGGFANDRQSDQAIRPELVRLQRCETDEESCENVVSNPITIKDGWRKAVLESDFECPLKGLVVIQVDWTWTRLAGGSADPGLPAVGMTVNDQDLMERLTGSIGFENGQFSRKWYFPADGNVISIRSVVQAAGQGNIDELSGKMEVEMAAAHIACEDAKVCIKTLAEDSELRANNALQSDCLEGTLQSDVCQRWRRCVQDSGAERQLQILLRAAALDPDDISAVEEEVAPAPAARLAASGATRGEPEEAEAPPEEPGAELAQVGSRGRCMHPQFMDTEAWYCLCIDEMQKACREISGSIRGYDETKCFQANGCYDPFNRVCSSWKSQGRRCVKLQAYTRELEKHQRASLLGRANLSAVGAAGGAARLDGTTRGKAHQCNH